jgi:hypothetical protein
MAAAPPESTPIYRAQLKVQTCDMRNAGTDDQVTAKLNDDNWSVLDYGRNDFPRNNSFTYDLVQFGVSQLSDISYLEISKSGSDGLCLYSLELIMNDVAIWSHTYDSGLWLDNSGDGGSRTRWISGYELRQHPKWQGYIDPPLKTKIMKEELESRIEAHTAMQIGGTALHWGDRGDRGVEVRKFTDTSLQVRIRLMYDVRYWPDPKVDVSMVASVCNDGKLAPEISGFSFSATRFRDMMESEVSTLEMLTGIAVSRALARQVEAGLSCPKIEDDANLSFSLPKKKPKFPFP